MGFSEQHQEHVLPYHAIVLMFRIFSWEGTSLFHNSVYSVQHVLIRNPMIWKAQLILYCNSHAIAIIKYLFQTYTICSCVNVKGI
jgi:hypothetical protein